MKFSVLITVLVICTGGSVSAQDNQKFSLGGPSPSRFTVPDITWPAAHGDADVCLWADDKLAAISLSIDDNAAYDHPWWIAQGDTLGFKFTWFVITGWIKGNESSLQGSWGQFRHLFELGHAVQSHSVAHGSNTVFQEVYGPGMLYTENWDLYYGGAKKAIEDSIPGNKCWTLAAPGSGTNDMPTAMKYSIANRGGVAYPQNADRINFNSITASSAFSRKMVLSTIDDTSFIYGKNYRRGLSCFLWHALGSGKEATAENLKFIKSFHDSLWVGTFPDIMRYNMEYATHTLTPLETSDSLISFTLTDSMADSIYTYPLTVKVRLNNDWDTCIGMQNGEPVDVTVITHAGDTYALVKVVPDMGAVMLSTDGRTSVVEMPNIEFLISNQKQLRMFRMDGQELPAGVAPAPGVYLAYDGTHMVKKIIMEK